MEEIEIERLLGSGVFRVKKENVREVLCQAILFENVKFGDGKLYVELVSILGLIQWTLIKDRWENICICKMLLWRIVDNSWKRKSDFGRADEL